jgi:hypothetical protein
MYKHVVIALTMYYFIKHGMMMSMGWDCVSELRLPTGVLLIPQVIHEHGEPWWNDVDRGNFQFVHHSSLRESYWQSHLVVKPEGLDEGNGGFCLRSISFTHVEFFYAPLKRPASTRLHGPISQKAVIFILTAVVRTWNLMFYEDYRFWSSKLYNFLHSPCPQWVRYPNVSFTRKQSEGQFLSGE